MLRIKDEYKGQIIRHNCGGNLITFDTNETPETDYEALQNLGFGFCFEQEQERPLKRTPIAYKGIDIDKATKVNAKKNGKKDKTETEKG